MPASLDANERVARALANLHVIAAISWKDFFDRTSHVESILQQDPAGVYPQMDFDTRDRYRRAVEDLAQGARRPEQEVAQAIVTQSRAAGSGERRSHVGYWLIEDGRKEVEAALGYRASPTVAARRWLLRHAGPCYGLALA